MAEEARPSVNAEERSRLTIAELRVRAEAVLLDVARQEPHLHFTADEVSEYAEPKKIRKALGMAKEDGRDLTSILAAAAAKLNKTLKTFRLEVEESTGWRDKLIAKLNDDAEWPEAISEAWSHADQVNEFHLTDPALGLLEYIRSGDLDSDFVSERSISYKTGLYGRERCIEPYLHEVRRKALIDLNWEKKDANWNERPMYRLWVGTAQLRHAKTPAALNPVFSTHLEAFKKADVDAARQMIYDNLLKLNPSDREDIYVLAISTRRELRRCFPHYTSRNSDVLWHFFGAISLNESLDRGYDFRDDAPVWTFAIRPKSGWAAALSAIRAELGQPSLQERFGLSDEAAKLLGWIEQLPNDKKLLGRLTPIVEKANEKWIGLEWPWHGRNTAAYLQLLIDEINDLTTYELKLQPWHEYGDVKSRIVIKQKTLAPLNDVLTRIRQLCEQLDQCRPNL